MSCPISWSGAPGMWTLRIIGALRTARYRDRQLAEGGYSKCPNASALLVVVGFDEVRFSGPSLPSSRSGPAVKGGPAGPSEASREAAPLTAGERRLRRRDRSVPTVEGVGELV